jgi:septal ring factor EnvC (AmiA/AmiB activator)
MRRLLATLLAVAALVAAANPVRADDESDLRTRLADVAAQITANNQEIARLQADIADRQRRIDRERVQLKILARGLYVQPDNTLLLLAQSPNLRDAMTEVADLVSAADRARATKAALQRDLDQLKADQTSLADRTRDLEKQKADLEAQYGQLVAMHAAQAAAASAAAAPAPPPPPAVSGPLPDVIRQAWAPLGPSVANWAVRLAQCESTMNPYAVNRSTGAAGLFQFLPSTWASTPWHAQSPFDPVANSQAAAWLYARYGAGQWVCSGLI